MKSSLMVMFCLLFLPTLSGALETGMEVGIRGGTHATSVDENYTAGELYFFKALPWRKELVPDVMVSTRFDAGVGYLHTAVEEGGWLALGGNVVLEFMEGLWAVECGFRPAWMFRHEFGDDHFGGPVQFASHAGIAVEFGEMVMNYRFQHLSNANIYGENPGLDLHLIGLGWRF